MFVLLVLGVEKVGYIKQVKIKRIDIGIENGSDVRVGCFKFIRVYIMKLDIEFKN